MQVQTGVNDSATTTYSIEIDWHITPELKREGLMREVVRHVQAARKDAGLNVDDRIVLSLATSDEELQHAIHGYNETIMAETLAMKLVETQFAYETTVKVEGGELKISLEKA
jgi:isoleucyl-tRNA synthetase